MGLWVRASASAWAWASLRALQTQAAPGYTAGVASWAAHHSGGPASVQWCAATLCWESRARPRSKDDGAQTPSRREAGPSRGADYGASGGPPPVRRGRCCAPRRRPAAPFPGPMLRSASRFPRISLDRGRSSSEDTAPGGGPPHRSQGRTAARVGQCEAHSEPQRGWCRSTTQRSQAIFPTGSRWPKPRKRAHCSSLAPLFPGRKERKPNKNRQVDNLHR